MSTSRYVGHRLLLVMGCWLAACGPAALPPASYPETAPVARADAKAPAPVQIELLRTEYRLEENGSFTSTVHQRYKVLSDQAVQGWGDTGASWSPWYMDRPVVTATVTSPGGAVSKLDPSTLSETAAYPEAPDVYGDSRVLRGPLPNVKVGSVVDEVVVIHTKRPFFGDGYAHRTTFQTGVPAEKVELDIELPEATPFHYEIRNAKVTVEDTRQAGRRHLVFRGGPYGALEGIEPLVPSDVPEWPHVAFSTGGSWQALVKEYARIVEARLHGPELASVAAQVVSPSDSARVKADKLLGWLRRRVRYAAIEFGESAITPREPRETLERGYGDCKDQAILIVGLLRAAGVPARVALLRAGSDEDVRKDLPGLNVFNHAIAVVPGDAPLWIDPTADYTRAGELPPPDEGRLALVVDEGTRELTRTPASDEKQNTYREVRTIHLPDLGRARIVEVSTGAGQIERGLRKTFVASRDRMKELLQGYVARAYNADAIGAFTVSPADDLAVPFKSEIEAQEAGMAISSLVSAEAILDTDPLFGWVPAPLAEGEARTTELELPMPYDAELRFEVHGPAGFVPGELPALHDLTLGPATLARALQVRGDGVVEARYRFTLPHRRWSAAEVTAFREAYAALRAEPHAHLAFVHEGQKHHLERHLDREIEAYRREVKAHPKSGVHRMRLAVALTDLGFAAGARALADEAVKLDPDDGMLHRFRGDIWSRDAFGRPTRPGYDRAAALAAYREAVRKSPDDMYSQVQIGLLLEHDGSGGRYTDASQLREAVAHYDQLDPEKLRAYEDGAHANNALFALLWSGRFEELRARILKLDRRHVPESLAVVAAAALGGPNQGLAEVLRLALPKESRGPVLDEAAGTLVRLRKYPEAAALSEAAAEGSSDPALRVRSRAQKKLRTLDPAGMPAGKPEELVAKAFALFIAQPAVAATQARAYVSARAYDRKGSSTALELLKAMAGADEPTEQSRAFKADALVAATTLTAEGSAAAGFRVNVSYDLSTAQRYEVFVVREAGGLRIRAFSTHPAELGCEALHLAKGGDRKSAAQWLDWAHEIVGSFGGQDPLRETPFARLWASGKGDVELAAAALCAEGPQTEKATEVLEAARAKATAEQQILLDHALALASTVEPDPPKELLAAVTRLEAEVPASSIARSLALRTLWEAGRYDAVRAKVTQILTKDPNEPLLPMLAEAELTLGHYAEAMRVGERLIASGKADAGDYNNQAWRSLFAGTVTDRELGYALRAVTAAPEDAGTLNTLAAVHADMGHTADAREMLAKVLSLRPGGKPNDADWYVVGRVAEQLALLDEARAAYGRIAKPEKVRSGTEYDLAQKRLQGLR
jgi:transglutaminase-like putative cysteine protease/tetratricopeptide (TPR) repeat protein